MEIPTRVWIEFLESPLAELELYGVPSKYLTSVEEAFGLYVKSIYPFTEEEIISRSSNFGRPTMIVFKKALRQHLKEILRKHGYLQANQIPS